MKNRTVQKLGTLLLVAIIGLPVFGSSVQPTLAAAQQTEIPEVVLLENNFRVSFVGVNYPGDGTSTWSYTVEELPDAQDLGYWMLETPFCAPILDAGPEPWVIEDPDPNSQLSGIKWDVVENFQQGQFWVKLDTKGQVGITKVAAKGPEVAIGLIAGPSCVEGEPPTEPPIDPGDQEPPTIEWIQPVPQFGIYDLEEGSSVDLLVNAADNLGVVRVEFLRWDANIEKFVTIAVIENPPYQVTVSSSVFNPTWNQVFAASFDAAGNLSDWVWIWVYRVPGGSLFEPPETNLFIPLVQR